MSNANITSIVNNYMSKLYNSAGLVPSLSGSLSGSTASYDDNPLPSVASQQQVNKLAEELAELKQSHNQLWDAYKALIIEHRAVMDRVDQITKAIGARDVKGPIVSNSGQYRPTGYYEEV